MINVQRVFLIGFMGTGKTTIGKKLAKAMNFPFIDLDAEIEKEIGCTIHHYFEKNGATKFRKLEREILEIGIQQNKKVIFSLGGGCPCFFDTMTLLNQTGITVYLHRPAKELYQRLINSKQKRPVLEGKNQEQLLLYIEQLLKERESFYKQASLIIERTYAEVELIRNRLLADYPFLLT